MMNSAAVIGRQLRQQQTSSRISGPVVPPTQYKGADVDKKFAQFSQLYTHEFYPHPAHREKGDKSNRTKEKKKKEPRVRLSWHCFCVALKAFSSGLVLFVAGTIMSVVGLFADSLSQENVPQANGANVNADMKTTLHNLTYVGPILMGLGGIWIVAACILTFEVRDTLGVKEEVEREFCDSPGKLNSPVKERPPKPTSADESTDNSKSAQDKHQTHSSHSKNHHVNKSASNSNQPTKKSTDLSKKPNQRPDRNHTSSKQTEQIEKAPAESLHAVNNLGPALMDATMTVQPATHTDIFSIDMTFVRIPSPQETQISDPEGCSPDARSKWKSRCSCSGSPTNSMLLAMYNFEDRQRTPVFGMIRKSGAPYLSQMSQRNSKILASVESDGLSSSTSSEWEIDNRVLETQQTAQQHMMHCFDPSSELPTNAFYLRASPNPALYSNFTRGNDGLTKSTQQRQNASSSDRNYNPDILSSNRSFR